MLDAVADAMPRAAPTASRACRAAARRTSSSGSASGWPATAPEASERDLPQLVRISLRVEADEEELVAGAVRLVLQVHDEQNPLHLCDAAVLWTERPTTASATGRGPTPRSRCAARPRPGRCSTGCSSCGCPTRSPSTATSWSACSRTASRALAARGVDVLWPRSLGRDLTATTVLDRATPTARARGAAPQRAVRARTSCSASAGSSPLHGDPLTEEEMDQLASSARAAAAAARQLDRHRPGDRPQGPQAGDPHRRSRPRRWRPRSPAWSSSAPPNSPSRSRWWSAPRCSRCASGCSPRRAGRRSTYPPGCTATLRDYQRQGLTWLVELTSLGLGACLADDMGLGKTITLIALHLHRVGGRPRRARRWWSARPACSATGSRSWRGSRPASPCAGSTATTASLEPGSTGGFVLTTYGTMRVSHERAGRGGLGPGRRRRGAARQERALVDGAGRCARSRAGSGSRSPARRWRTT